MLQTPLAKASAVLTAAVVIWALARGRWPERVAAVVIAVDWTGSTVFQVRRPYHQAQPVMFALDLLQAAILLGVAMGCRRTWVLWGAAMATLLALTHVVFMLDERFGQWSYLTAVYVWSLGLLVVLGAGVVFEGRKPAGAPLWWNWWLGFRAVRPSIPSARAQRRS